MRLITLELENFRQYAHAQIAFESGVTAIVGANGAGKTTLVEAILWALYGARVAREGAETLRFLWSQGGAKVRVTLEFELGKRRYRIRRTPTEADLAQLSSDGGWLPLARGTTSVNERVLHLLGMNAAQFQTSFCARQKELEFMAYTPQKRREEISKMLGYERVSDAIEQVGQTARTLQAEVDGLRQGIGDPQAVAQQLQEVETALQQTEADLQQQQSALQQAVARRDAARTQFEQQTALREQHLALQRQRDLLANDCQHAELRVNELRQRWNELKEAQERYKRLKPDAEQYQFLMKALREMDELADAERERARLQSQLDAECQRQAQLQAEQAELQQKQSALSELEPNLQQARQLEQQLQQIRQIAQQAPRRVRLETELKTKQEQIDALRQRERERDALQQELSATQAELNARQRALDAADAQLQAALKAWHNERAAAEAELRALQNALQQQQERVQQLESLGEQSECPTCGQPIGKAYQEVLQRAQQEVRTTEQALRAARTRLRQLEQEPAAVQALREQLRQRQHERDAAQQQLAEQQARLRQLETELSQIAELERQIRDLQRQLQRIPVYDPAEEHRLQDALNALQPQIERAQQLQGELRRLPSVQTELRQIAQRLRQLQQQISQLPAGYDAQRHAQLRDETERLRPAYEEAVRLLAILRERDALKEQAEQAVRELDAKRKELEQIENQLAQLNYSEQAYLQAARAFQEADEQAQTLERAVAQLNAEYLSQTRLRDHLQQQLEQIRLLQQQLREKERALMLHQTLRKALQEFRTELNTRLRPMLASIAAEFLSALTNGRYTELDIDEEYHFTVIDEGQRKAVISGGEEDIVNLSLRLALARLITERAGQPLSLLILDEVFASLDAERRQNVMELLNNLRSWFDQILVISHFEEINDAADRCLRVRRNPLTRASEIVEAELPSLMLLETEVLSAKDA